MRTALGAVGFGTSLRIRTCCRERAPVGEIKVPSMIVVLHNKMEGTGVTNGGEMTEA